MFAPLIQRLRAVVGACTHQVQCHLRAATKPAPAGPVRGTLADLARRKPALIAENALLRHQLLILQRRVKRPRCTTADRTVMVLLSSRLSTWRQTVLIVQPQTVVLAKKLNPGRNARIAHRAFCRSLQPMRCQVDSVDRHAAMHGDPLRRLTTLRGCG